jgi:hypothetical protein
MWTGGVCLPKYQPLSTLVQPTPSQFAARSHFHDHTVKYPVSGDVSPWRLLRPFPYSLLSVEHTQLPKHVKRNSASQPVLRI